MTASESLKPFWLVLKQDDFSILEISCSASPVLDFDLLTLLTFPSRLFYRFLIRKLYFQYKRGGASTSPERRNRSSTSAHNLTSPRFISVWAPRLTLPATFTSPSKSNPQARTPSKKSILRPSSSPEISRFWTKIGRSRVWNSQLVAKAGGS